MKIPFHIKMAKNNRLPRVAHQENKDQTEAIKLIGEDLTSQSRSLQSQKAEALGARPLIIT